MVPMQITVPFLGFAVANFVFRLASSLTGVKLKCSLCLLAVIKPKYIRVIGIRASFVPLTIIK